LGFSIYAVQKPDSSNVRAMHISQSWHRVKLFPAVIIRRFDKIELQQLFSDDARQLVSEPEHRPIVRDVRVRHHPMTDAVPVQVLVEMTLLVVLILADVHRNVHVPVRLSVVTGQTSPTEVIL